MEQVQNWPKLPAKAPKKQQQYTVKTTARGESENHCEPSKLGKVITCTKCSYIKAFRGKLAGEVKQGAPEFSKKVVDKYVRTIP